MKASRTVRLIGTTSAGVLSLLLNPLFVAPVLAVATLISRATQGRPLAHRTSGARPDAATNDRQTLRLQR
jgi:hypothetical protein